MIMKKHFYNIAVMAMMLGLSACSLSFEEEQQERIAGHYEYIYTGMDEGDTFAEPETKKGKTVSTKVAGTKKTRKQTFKNDESFDTASISDDTLSGMRGGFISVSGLKINFGLYSQTTVNNNIVSNLTVSTNGLNGILPQNLNQLIQTGGGNQAAVTSSSVPVNVMTVVQNTTDNQIIQNANVLDITVSNMAAYREQQINNNLRFITLNR